MPRCNLTLKQKAQLIELSDQLSTGDLAKKFRVHTTTVTRTIKKKEKILYQASRVNPNFKTVQTNLRSEEHDTLVLDYIRTKQETNTPISVNDICDKAIQYANLLGRQIKSRRAWWRRFRIRCNVVRMKVCSKAGRESSDDESNPDKDHKAKFSTTNGEPSPKRVVTLPAGDLHCMNLESPLRNAQDQDPTCEGIDEDQKLNTSNDLNENHITAPSGGACESVSHTDQTETYLKPAGRTRKVAKKDQKGVNKTSVTHFTFKIKRPPTKCAHSG